MVRRSDILISVEWSPLFHVKPSRDRFKKPGPLNLMELEMLNLKSLRIAVATTFAATLLTVNPLQAADDWFEQQRSISDGYSPVNTSAGAEGRQAPAASATNNSSWLEQQLSISDGYSP